LEIKKNKLIEKVYVITIFTTMLPVEGMIKCNGLLSLSSGQWSLLYHPVPDITAFTVYVSVTQNKL